MQVRYCGRPLDVYKNQWMKKKRLEHVNENASLNEEAELFHDSAAGEAEAENLKSSSEASNVDDPLIIKHELLASRTNIE